MRVCQFRHIRTSAGNSIFSNLKPESTAQTTSTPMLRAVPATERMAAARSKQFRSGILILAISSICCWVVTDDFELDPVRKADFAGQSSGTDGFVGGVTGSGVWKDEDFFAIDVVDERFLGLVGEIHATNRDGDHVRAGGGVSAGHFLKAAVLPCSDDEARIKRSTCDNELIWHEGFSKEIVVLGECDKQTQSRTKGGENVSAARILGPDFKLE